MNSYYYLDAQQQVQGPVNLEELKKLHATGVLVNDSLVAQGGAQEWKRYADLFTPPVPPQPSQMPASSSQRSHETSSGKTSGLATTSLVLGCTSFCLGLLSGIPAVIFGILALNKINKNHALQGKGLAIAGICLGGCSLFMTAILAALAIPAVNAAVEQAKATQALSEIRQVGIVLSSYANGHDGVYPDNLDVLLSSGALSSSTVLYKPGTKEPKWILTPGLTTHSAPDTILLQSVDTYHRGTRKSKVVYKVDNSASLEYEKSP